MVVLHLICKWLNNSWRTGSVYLQLYNIHFVLYLFLYIAFYTCNNYPLKYTLYIYPYALYRFCAFSCIMIVRRGVCSGLEAGTELQRMLKCLYYDTCYLVSFCCFLHLFLPQFNNKKSKPCLCFFRHGFLRQKRLLNM